MEALIATGLQVAVVTRVLHGQLVDKETAGRLLRPGVVFGVHFILVWGHHDLA